MFFYIVYDIVYDIVYHIDISFSSWQIHLINKSIVLAKQRSPLYRLQMLADPSERLKETHVTALKWDIKARKFDMTAETLQKLQGMSVSLLELLNLSVPSGEMNAWKFKKAHSILHKVRELLLFGWSEN